MIQYNSPKVKIKFTIQDKYNILLPATLRTQIKLTDHSPVTELLHGRGNAMRES